MEQYTETRKLNGAMDNITNYTCIFTACQKWHEKGFLWFLMNNSSHTVCVCSIHVCRRSHCSVKKALWSVSCPCWRLMNVMHCGFKTRWKFHSSLCASWWNNIKSKQKSKTEALCLHFCCSLPSFFNSKLLSSNNLFVLFTFQSWDERIAFFSSAMNSLRTVFLFAQGITPKKLSSFFHLFQLLFVHVNFCFLLSWSPRSKVRCVSPLKLTFLFQQRKKKKGWETEGEGGSRGERENSSAGFISSFSSVWLPDISWPFQPSQRYPPSASLHHLPPLSPAFSSLGFICHCSLRFQSVEIRVKHKTAWSGGERKRKERKRIEDRG